MLANRQASGVCEVSIEDSYMFAVGDHLAAVDSNASPIDLEAVISSDITTYSNKAIITATNNVTTNITLAAAGMILIEQGENIKYIQTQLGHSSPTVTWNVYAHLMKPVNQKAPSKLENTILKSNDSKMVAETKKGEMAETITPRIYW